MVFISSLSFSLCLRTNLGQFGGGGGGSTLCSMSEDLKESVSLVAPIRSLDKTGRRAANVATNRRKPGES